MGMPAMASLSFITKHSTAPRSRYNATAVVIQQHRGHDSTPLRSRYNATAVVIQQHCGRDATTHTT